MSTVHRVVFVCEHGAAKSVLAAAEFNALARSRGLPVSAIARGTVPDACVAPAVADRLAREGVDLSGVVPEAVTAADLGEALRVVAFDQPQVASMLPDGLTLDQWDGMPPVSGDFDRARQAIRSNVKSLIDELTTFR